MTSKPDKQPAPPPSARDSRTAIVHKHAGASGGPPSADRLYYVVARDGLFIGRNHEFFRSCVPAGRGPGDLAEQRPFFEPRFPPIPQPLLEQAVGFFDRIAELHVCEASVLLAWDRVERRVRLVVPEQTATVTLWSDGYRAPIGLHYYPPTDLPRDWVLFGDIHSHVDFSAYSSVTDQEDEAHDAGLHLVVGRIQAEPPEFHVEAVVDGTRFPLELEQVAAGYGRRDRDVPQEWIGRVAVESTRAWSGAWTSSGSSWSSSSSSSWSSAPRPGDAP